MEETAKTSVSNPEEMKTAQASGTAEGSKGSKLPLVIAIVIAVLAGLVYLFICLDPQTTGSVRDIMLIIFVIGSLVTVASVAVLCVSLSKMIGFLKYDLQPILSTTDRTMKKVSGTVSYLCESAVEPTIDAASKVSGIKNAANSVFSVFKKQ